MSSSHSQSFPPCSVTVCVLLLKHRMRAIASALHPTLCSLSPQKSDQPTASTTVTTTSTSLAIEKPKSILQKHPLYSQTHANLSLQFKEKILCLEILGIDSSKALALNPSLHTASLQSIHAIISFLQSKGIHQKDLPRIFGMCPQILTSNIKSELNPVFGFLSSELRVPEQNFRKVINKCPRLLICSVRDQLKPALFYLYRLGFRDFEALAYRDPVLLASNVENTLMPKLEYLIGLGFTRDETIGMVLRCPSLFTFSIENNFKPKVEYFLGEMNGKLQDLKEFPQYFAFSLDKRIKPRHLEVLQSGVEMPLPLLLKSTDQEFDELLRQLRQGRKLD